MFSVFDGRSRVCEIGVWLSPQEQGRGLMTAAARHLVDWAIRERGMSRVEWLTDTRNVKSRAIAERLGLTFEGVLRSAHVVAGERQDCAVWAVLAADWPGRSTVDGSTVGATAGGARATPDVASG
jgi:ribosomal-protein-serine acetyltransferase